MKIIYVGSFVSEDMSINDKRISQAGNNYQLKLIEILQPAIVLSLVPIFLRKKISAEGLGISIINNQSKLPNRLNYI